jgi:hypothetical protein
MAVPRGTRFEVEHDQVFADGAAIVGPVSADMEYISNEDRARGKQPKQRIDEATGLLQWKVTVSDPSADKDRDKSRAKATTNHYRCPRQPTNPPLDG